MPTPNSPPATWENDSEIRTVWDKPGDWRNDLETNIMYSADGTITYSSNGRDLHLPVPASPAALGATQSYVNAFRSNDAALAALGDAPMTGSLDDDVPKGSYRLLLFRPSPQGQSVRQVITGQLATAPAPVRSVLDAAAALRPYLTSNDL
jgi:hypothetical protein